MKQWNYLEPLKKDNEDENGQNVPHLEIAEVVLVYCNNVNKNDDDYY